MELSQPCFPSGPVPYWAKRGGRAGIWLAGQASKRRQGAAARGAIACPEMHGDLDRSLDTNFDEM